MIAIPWVGVIISVVLVPVPESSPVEPGAVIQVTIAEDETPEDLARRIEMHVELITNAHTLLEAAAHPDVAELEARYRREPGLSNWMAEHIEVHLRREVGEIRVWFDEGTAAQRVALTNAVIDAYLAHLESDREDASDAVERWERNIGGSKAILNDQRKMIQLLGQAAIQNPQVLQGRDLDEWAASLEEDVEKIKSQEARLRYHQQEVQDLNGVQVLSRAILSNNDR